MAGTSNFDKLFGVILAQEFLTQSRITFVIFLTVCALDSHDIKHEPMEDIETGENTREEVALLDFDYKIDSGSEEESEEELSETDDESPSENGQKLRESAKMAAKKKKLPVRVFYRCDHCNYVGQKNLEDATVCHKCKLGTKVFLGRNGMEKLQCDICAKFISLTSFQKHKEFKHYGLRYKCEKCYFLFLSVTNKNDHKCLKDPMRKNIKIYKCDHCPKGFLEEEFLVKHSQTEHTECGKCHKVMKNTLWKICGDCSQKAKRQAKLAKRYQILRKERQNN